MLEIFRYSRFYFLVEKAAAKNYRKYSWQTNSLLINLNFFIHKLNVIIPNTSSFEMFIMNLLYCIFLWLELVMVIATTDHHHSFTQ